VRNESDFLKFIARYAGTRLVCCGLNPRSTTFFNKAGYPRSARENEIEASRALLLDLDPVEETVRLEEAKRSLDRIDTYFKDHGFQLPTVANSGKGYHLVAIYPAIRVDDCPDIHDRLAAFASGLRRELEKEFAAEGIYLDSTSDLRRLVKVYGTAKPGGLESRLQRFRPEPDPQLREYLMSLQPEMKRNSNENLPLPDLGVKLPSWFPPLLEKPVIDKLWRGEGKPAGSDRSRSGYDFSLALRLIREGYNDPNDLATILALRPGGAFQGRGGNVDYLRRTIANALHQKGRPKN